MSDLSNNPRAIELLRERVDDLRPTIKLWDEATIDSADMAARAVDFDQQLFAALEQLKQDREVEIRPHRDAAATVRTAWEPLEGQLAAARAMMAAKLKPYLQAHGSVRGEVSGKLRSLRKEWRVTEIDDAAEVFLWAIGDADGWRQEILDCLLMLAQRQVRQGARPGDIPGVRIEQVEV